MKSTLALAIALALSPHAALADAKQAFEALRKGNLRFVEGKGSHPRAEPPRAKELAAKHPSAIVLSCSDSRVPPEMIFDQGPGEIFSVAVAGNALGNTTVASIEYAVENLSPSLIVVMGHESCGAIQAAMTTPLGKSAGSPDLDALLSSIKPHLVDSSRAIASNDPGLRQPVMRNVDGVAARLTRRSRIVRKRIEAGKLAVVHGIYSMETGKVEFWHTEGAAGR